MSATLSPCGQYRYDLWREWDASLPLVAWIALNPSTADAESDDPSSRRMIQFSKDAGFGRMVLVNLFALRSTDPAALKTHPRPIGPENDEYLRRVIRDVETVICAWGSHGKFRGRGDRILFEFRAAAKTPYCLRMTKGGQPEHPLYLPSALRPIEFGRGP